jgi:hypothetical protein
MLPSDPQVSRIESYSTKLTANATARHRVEFAFRNVQCALHRRAIRSL